MPQKQNYFEIRATQAAKNEKKIKLYWVGSFIKNS
jgi:hypothetical protein